MVFEIIYTSIMVPYETLATEMTDHFSLRSKRDQARKLSLVSWPTSSRRLFPASSFCCMGKDSATPFFLTGLTYGAILIGGYFLPVVVQLGA